MRKYVSVCAVVAALAFQGTSSADIILVRADIEAVDPNGGVGGTNTGLTGPPLRDVDLITATGKTFTNTYVSAGTPFVPNTGRVRAIVATEVVQMRNGTTYAPINPIGMPGGTIVQISVVDGILTAPGQVQFTSGRSGYLGTFGFDANDPTTWGLTVTGDGAGGPLVDTVAGSFFAEYTLGPKDFVTWNNGDPISFEAALVNTSSVNSTAIGEQTQGRFHFLEVGNPSFVTATPAVVVPGNPGPVNIPNIPYTEGLLFTTADDIELDLLNSIQAGWVNGVTAAQNVLNAIGMWGIGSVVTGATINTVDAGFADFGNLTSADYIPVFNAQGINTSGDFRANANIAGRPTVSPVPEPSSMFAFAICALPVILRMRRRKAVAAC